MTTRSRSVIAALSVGGLLTILARASGRRLDAAAVEDRRGESTGHVEVAAVSPQTRDKIAVTGWLGFIGGIATVGARLAYEDYYRPLGVTLDQVGLGTPRLISIAAVAVLTISGFVGVGAAMVVILSAPDRWWNHLTAGLGAVLVAASLFMGILHALHLTIILGVSLGLGALIAPWLPLRPGWEDSGRLVSRSACAAVVAVMALVWWQVDRSARESALSLANGRPAGHSLADGLLDVAAEPVCLEPSGDTVLGIPHAVTLLGTAEGVHIVLVPGARTALVPVGEVVVTAGHFASGTRRPVCP